MFEFWVCLILIGGGAFLPLLCEAIMGTFAILFDTDYTPPGNAMDDHRRS